ncbi:dTDP-4-dehydrorhamnose 3,5-epimerase [Sphingomonas sp. IC-56]|uniref:dTDP-4-dehydrorhamnose 3,5-epimerase n=1 Tax=Sphingomonas sp. IC-56 TaxID=2898529 RepID=UPI001E2F5394|nr:dTDP-4-dehydrorhamnose 3,5-epimerase [Sphingomonas sp. IC-56]
MTSPVQLIPASRHVDSRGWFTEVYSERNFTANGRACRFVQDNHSLSVAPFTLRGLHFQVPPHSQAKLVRCVRGRIYDVAVDMRSGSPTYGHWVAAELTAENGSQMFVPAGFAHGFLTLESDCEIMYKVSDFYAPDCDAGIRWDSVPIAWPLPDGALPELSPKDAALPALENFHSPFVYDGHPLEPLG